MIVGMNARALWRGPKVLNGRNVTAGVLERAVIALGELVGCDFGR